MEPSEAAESPAAVATAAVAATAVAVAAVDLRGLKLPRSNLNSTYQEPQPIDPFGLAAHGLDAGLGTMLLQGVAEVR